MPAELKPKSFESRRNSYVLLCSRAYFNAILLPQSDQYPNLSEGANSVGGQLRVEKKVPLQRYNELWKTLALLSVH